MMKRIISIAAAALMAIGMLASCGAKNDNISVIIREEGSGTRSAFAELLEITDKDGNDASVSSAEQTSSTSVMITSVAGNKNAIGYISLGSLSDEIKAVKVDGVEASAENVTNGTYKVARPFIIAYKEDKLSDLAKDFMNYILSEDGQKIIEEKGYVRQEASGSYKASGLSGKITLAGSTSVSPVMDVLADQYKKLNSGVEIEIQQSGSGAGITSAIEGVCDFGMSSRELKDSEKAELTPVQIAKDGIAVIVNKENTIDDLSADQIRAIFKGEVTTWSEVSK